MLGGEIDGLFDENGAIDEEAIVRVPGGEMVYGVDIAPTLRSALFRWSNRVYADFVAMGLPHGAGPLQERLLTVQVIRVWHRAQSAVQADQWEQARGTTDHH